MKWWMVWKACKLKSLQSNDLAKHSPWHFSPVKYGAPNTNID